MDREDSRVFLLAQLKGILHYLAAGLQDREEQDI